MQITDHGVVKEQLELRRHQLEGILPARGEQHLHRLLHEVDAALGRLDRGDYGICEECLEPMEEERLLANPLHRVCLECLSADETRALEHDLETAAVIQGALLPEQDYCRSGWDIHFEYQPVGPVSGDHLDLIEPLRPDEPLVFLFGDVAGKGVAASLLTSHLHALFRSLLTLDLPLEELIGRANRIFCESTPANAYATLVVGRLGAGGEVELCNLGHCPPLIVRQDRVETISASTVPFGLFDQGVFEVNRFVLEEDDFLFLYTDGLSEAANEWGEEYGQQRIISTLEKLRGVPPADAIAGSLSDLRRFRNGGTRRDDLTVMVSRPLPLSAF